MGHYKADNLDRNINWKRLHDWVKVSLKEDKTGHDYEHIKRVLKTAIKIADKCTNVDYDVLFASCLLHDISFKDGYVIDHHIKAAEESAEILKLLGFNEEKVSKIKEAIEDHVGHMKKPLRENFQLQIESKILRDADNIDALGSIGLIRMISFCFSKGIPYFITKEDKLDESLYGSVKFLVDWPEKMLTAEGRRIGEKRADILKRFLEQLEKDYS
jgi:uncharacterized protein